MYPFIEMGRWYPKDYAATTATTNWEWAGLLLAPFQDYSKPLGVAQGVLGGCSWKCSRIRMFQCSSLGLLCAKHVLSLLGCIPPAPASKIKTFFKTNIYEIIKKLFTVFLLFYGINNSILGMLIILQLFFKTALISQNYML